MKRSTIAVLVTGGMLACADSTAVKGPRVYDVVVELNSHATADRSNPTVCGNSEIMYSDVGTLTSPVLDSASGAQAGAVDFLVMRGNTALQDVWTQGKITVLGDSVRMWWGIRNGNPDEGYTNFHGRRSASGVIQGVVKVMNSAGACVERYAGTFKATPR
jgi:hypothetical protein